MSMSKWKIEDQILMLLNLKIVLHQCVQENLEIGKRVAPGDVVGAMAADHPSVGIEPERIQYVVVSDDICIELYFVVLN